MKKYNGTYGQRPTIEENQFGNAIAAVSLIALGMIAGAIASALICYQLWA